MGLEAKDLELVIDTTTFIFQQAAYHMAKPGQLKTHLTNIALDEDKVHARDVLVVILNMQQMSV